MDSQFMLCTVLSLSFYTYLLISRKASRLCSVQYYRSLFIHTWSSPGRIPLMLCTVLSLSVYTYLIISRKDPAYALYSIITLCLYILDHLQEGSRLCSVQYNHSLFIHTWSSPGRPPAYTLYSIITLYLYCTYLIISRKASSLCSVQYNHSLFIHTWSSLGRLAADQ